MIVGESYPTTIGEVVERFFSLSKEARDTICDCVCSLSGKGEEMKHEHTCKGNIINVDFKKVQKR